MEELLKSKDFMKIGQAIEHGNWQVAMMAIGRMITKATELEDEYFVKHFKQLKMAAASRNKQQAQNILALIVNKRAKLLNEMLKD